MLPRVCLAVSLMAIAIHVDLLLVPLAILGGFRLVFAAWDRSAAAS